MCVVAMTVQVHRVGRTGRAGHKGTAITFITPQEEQYAGDMVKALKQSKSPVPIELQQMADSFEAKVKEGNAKHRRSGYHTKGFKFDEAEAGEKEVIKNMQRRQVEVENGIISAEEAQQQEADEHTVREKFNIKLVNAPEEGEEDKGPSMQELLKKIDEEDSDNDDVFGHRENENGGAWGASVTCRVDERGWHGEPQEREAQGHGDRELAGGGGRRGRGQVVAGGCRQRLGVLCHADGGDQGRAVDRGGGGDVR